MSTSSPEKSILTLLSEAVNAQGVLPEQFSLPRVMKVNELNFADGAKDGIRLYHTQRNPVEFDLLKQAILLVNEDKKEEALQNIASYFEKVTMLEVVDTFQQWMIQQQATLSVTKISAFAITLVATSTLPEPIKMGLAMLELLNTDLQQELKKIIRLLALSDEFSLYCLFIMRNWTSANQEIFQVGQRTKGWGRIHAIELLKPETEEIKEWLLKEGCNNEVSPSYSALVCAEKCDLLSWLSIELSQEEFHGLTLLIRGLLDEGPMQGISQYPYAQAVLEGYLKQAAAHPMNLETATDLLAIYDWAEKNKGELIKEIIVTLLKKKECLDAVMKAMEEGRGFEEGRRLGLPYDSLALNQVRRKPLESASLLHYLMPQPDFAEELLKLYEGLLPLQQMASGPADWLGMGKDYQNYQVLSALLQGMKNLPNKSVVLVQTGLLSPVVSCRTQALDVVECWLDSKAKLNQELLLTLAQAKELEIKEDLKERLQKLVQN